MYYCEFLAGVPTFVLFSAKCTEQWCLFISQLPGEFDDCSYCLPMVLYIATITTLTIDLNTPLQKAQNRAIKKRVLFFSLVSNSPLFNRDLARFYCCFCCVVYEFGGSLQVFCGYFLCASLFFRQQSFLLPIPECYVLVQCVLQKGHNIRQYNVSKLGERES